MSKVKLSEEEIDRIVTAQAEDHSAWDEPIHLGKFKSSSRLKPRLVKVEQRILGRLEELIAIGEQISNTRTSPPPRVISDDSVDEQSFIQWRTNCLNLLGRVGQGSIYYRNFDSLVGEIADYTSTLKGLAVLKAAKDDYERGYLFDTRVLIEGEVFEDFLEQASHLLEKQYSGPAATIAGIVLEEGLRKLCQQNNVILPARPTIGPMNDALVKTGLYGAVVKQRIVALAAIRNRAAHGQWNEFTLKDVEDMIEWVKLFLENSFGNTQMSTR